jgi:hypothetical protein
MSIFLRNEMVGKLQQGKCEVFFKKKNGEVRHMMCTLNPDMTPDIQEERVKSAPEKTISEEVIAVWDLEKIAWRSFRTDSVLVFNERNEA